MCLGKISILIAIWFWEHLASHSNCQVSICRKPIFARQLVYHGISVSESFVERDVSEDTGPWWPGGTCRAVGMQRQLPSLPGSMMFDT